MNEEIRTDGSGRRGKVERVIDEYELEGLGDELERAWTAADPDERESLRDLATRFNEQVLEAALLDAGDSVVQSEVETMYELLTDDTVGSGDRRRVERRLERQGVDVASLRSDFASYQAIRTYLKSERGAEHRTVDVDRGQKAIETVQRLRARLVTVAEDRLQSLRSAGRISLGQFRVIVDLRVVCEDCGTQQAFTTLIEEGGCDCNS
ncbi:rod-determining factor RdfA [Haloglomus litoreum]|uniref:rod-determining factor RdfA n=1 Tax=Haloglomus litoreum TaxID=3034026 RepID=UPI0023E7A40C|nr:rod-determining factor RdfA [Haloglomus sp. DT116]